MRWSQSFIPTLRETPAEAESASHQLLLRAGYMRQVAAGVYSYLPLAQRSLLKIAQIIREEMNRIGGQEFYLPVIHPAELWQESGRWQIMGETMFRLKDRAGREMCLGMTHEEVITDIARRELRSYRQLPQTWYQIQEKFRDEQRPKGGLLRTRQFTMKDAYSFHLTAESLDEAYQKHYEAYCRIFDRCGVRYIPVEASSGAMGGHVSQEFSAPAEGGEDLIATCECGYAANLEMAIARAAPIQDPPSSLAKPEKFSTPNVRTIEALVTFTHGEAAATRQIKTLVYLVDNQPTLILLRGDHQLNEARLTAILGHDRFRPGHPEEIFAALGAHPGSLGAVGVTKYRILADRALQVRTNLFTGANEDDFHLRGVDPARDFKAEYHDLRRVEDGDLCVKCGRALRVQKALEIGQIFKLGTRYSETMKATVLDEKGNQVPLIMGCYGIGLGRILAAAIEQNYDEDGMILPASIAPFEVIVTIVNTDEPELLRVGEKIYEELRAGGVEALLDDRNERPGVKFKDADLIGIPLRVTVGSKKLKEQKVEIYDRAKRSTTGVSITEIVSCVRQCLNQARV